MSSQQGAKIAADYILTLKRKAPAKAPRGEDGDYRTHITNDKSAQEAVASISRPGDRPLRSKSPQARTVAGYVSRRNDRTSRAAPAPSRASKSTLRGNTAGDKGKGKQSDKLDGDDGSDSDEFRKRGRRNDAEVESRSRMAPTTTPEDRGSTSRQYRTDGLSSEEIERINLRRSLVHLEGRWDRLMQQREDCNSRRRYRELALFRKWRTSSATTEDSTAFQTILQKTSEEDEAMRIFKEEIVFGVLAAQLDEEKKEILDSKLTTREYPLYLARIRWQIEDGVIARCRELISTDTQKQQFRIRVVLGMYFGLWTEILTQRRSQVQDVAEITRAFLASKCPVTGPDILVDQYVDRLSMTLADTIIHDQQAGKPLEADPLEAENVPLITMIKNSEQGGAGAEQYYTWMMSSLDHDEVDLRIQRLYRVDLERRAEKAQEDAREFQKRIAQGLVFFQTGDEVSIIFFKQNRPSSMRSVSPEDLIRMGWRRSTVPGSLYWRYQFGSTDRLFSHEDGDISERPFNLSEMLFKVQMDGEVIGIWTPVMDIDWNDIN
jgi:hypothetical protein